MGHKASPRRTGKIRKQIGRWHFNEVFKVPKKSKGIQKQKIVVHVPPAW